MVVQKKPMVPTAWHKYNPITLFRLYNVCRVSLLKMLCTQRLINMRILVTGGDRQ